MTLSNAPNVQKLYAWLPAILGPVFGRKRTIVSETTTTWRFSALGVKHSGEYSKLTVEVPAEKENEGQ